MVPAHEGEPRRYDCNSLWFIWSLASVKHHVIVDSRLSNRTILKHFFQPGLGQGSLRWSGTIHKLSVVFISLSRSNHFFSFFLSENRGMSGGKVSYEGAILLRTERTADHNKHVRAHNHQVIIRRWSPVSQIRDPQAEPQGRGRRHRTGPVPSNSQQQPEPNLSPTTQR